MIRVYELEVHFGFVRRDAATFFGKLFRRILVIVGVRVQTVRDHGFAGVCFGGGGDGKLLVLVLLAAFARREKLLYYRFLFGLRKVLVLDFKKFLILNFNDKKKKLFW